MQIDRFKIFAALHLLMLFFSCGGILSKAAGKQPFFSFRFLLYYGGELVILALFSLAWQQILKRMPLTTAYANKAVTVVWAMLFGVLFFQETISVFQIIGAAVIMAGIYLVVTADA